ncbi:MAG: VanW family protein [Bacillota bacterium]|nr:VanW family protein [Bacillota bacterium]
MKKKVIIAIIAAAVLITGGGLTAGLTYVHNKTKVYSNIMLPGVKIENENVSDKTKDEAKNIITFKYQNVMLQKKINIKAGDKTYTIDYSKLNGKYNIDETINDAFNYGKSLNMFELYKIIKNAPSKQYNLKFTYDDKPVKDLVSSIAKEVNKNPSNAGIGMESKGKFNVVKDIKGNKLNEDKLQKDIISQINGSIINSSTDVAAEINQVNANITEDTLSKINTLIASFSTDYSSSSYNRATNIELATSAINGKWLIPGDTFSFNDTVGERTAARGYKEAPVLIGNKADSGLGGGICQVSSTLYNAIARASINATERTHHTLPSSYVELGMDATVDYGNIDFKFKNTLSFPIYIEGITNNRTITFNIYSNDSLAKNTYDLVNEIYAQQQPSVKYINDSSLPLGQQVVDQYSHIGYKVKVYRKKFENGVFVSQELVSDDNYLPADEIIKVGTKK